MWEGSHFICLTNGALYILPTVTSLCHPVSLFISQWQPLTNVLITCFVTYWEFYTESVVSQLCHPAILYGERFTICYYLCHSWSIKAYSIILSSCWVCLFQSDNLFLYHPVSMFISQWQPLPLSFCEYVYFTVTTSSCCCLNLHWHAEPGWQMLVTQMYSTYVLSPFKLESSIWSP